MLTSPEQMRMLIVVAVLIAVAPFNAAFAESPVASCVRQHVAALTKVFVCTELYNLHAKSIRPAASTVGIRKFKSPEPDGPEYEDFGIGEQEGRGSSCGQIFPNSRLFNKRNVANGDVATAAFKGMQEAYVTSYKKTDGVAMKIGRSFTSVSGLAQERDAEAVGATLKQLAQISEELQKSLTAALGREPREFESGLCGLPVGSASRSYQVPISLPRIVGPDPRFLATSAGVNADYAKFLAWFEASPIGKTDSK